MSLSMKPVRKRRIQLTTMDKTKIESIMQNIYKGITCLNLLIIKHGNLKFYTARKKHD